MNMEQKFDIFVEKVSEFQGAVRSDLEQLKTRSTRMEQSLEAHKDAHAADLKDELSGQKKGESHRWEVVIMSVLSVASLAIACAALFVNQPK
jgi:hypothetical protein